MLSIPQFPDIRNAGWLASPLSRPNWPAQLLFELFCEFNILPGVIAEASPDQEIGDT
jgi:hypothetical protein